MRRLRIVAAIVLCLPAAPGQRPPVHSETSDSRIWIGRHQEFEEYLRTGECIRLEPLSNSATLRCTLRPGGPAARMAWRSLPPGTYRGFRESYKTEIAAYELDKLLKMNMVPPTVSRQVQGADGAAQLWVEHVVDNRGKESPTESRRAAWDAQTVRMVMFDNLIGNRDRNLANMLRDANWNLILIDHSRAFGTGAELYHKMTRIDRECWASMAALTRGQLDRALREWLGDREIQAILDRRDRMATEVGLLARP